MSDTSIPESIRLLVREWVAYFKFIRRYVRVRGYRFFSKFEVYKDYLVDLLYRKRGRYVRPFLHFGVVGLTFLVITIGPYIFNQTESEQPEYAGQGVLSTEVYGASFYTQQAEELRQIRAGEIITHVVAEGETLSTIAQRYGLEVTTILWENNLDEKVTLKPGAELRILPLNGVRHKVQRGETIFSIGKKYGLEESAVQVIVDYPFNEFLNDETFELATGQFLMIPDGVPPKKEAPKPTYKPLPLTPSGSGAAAGSFIWPAAGGISQGYRFYHKAIDIANRGGGPILAADGGTVVAAGWDSNGYGNRVVIDHANGNITLYAHMSVLQVSAGQRLNRGDVIGQMGSTGRSTGTHLHFEIRRGGVLLNPLEFLQ